MLCSVIFLYAGCSTFCGFVPLCFLVVKRCSILKMKKKKESNLKVLLVAQEIQLAKLLAGNKKDMRDRALKNLKQWITNRSLTQQLTEDDFQRLWKGLFYSMWMSDKPLVQEECAENIANLIHFPKFETSLLFFKSGLIVLSNEWQGIDQLRLDKFMMFVRRLLRHMFVVLKKHGFNKQNIECFNDVVNEAVLESTSVPMGLFMHFTEIFMEELAKISEGKIHPDRLVDIVLPYIKKFAKSTDDRQIRHIKKFIFTYLMKQTDLGIDYEMKYNVWKQLGFPGSIHSLQRVKRSKEDKEDGSNVYDKKGVTKNKPLDPRAGRVDVEIPQLKFNAKGMSQALLNNKFLKDSNKKTRRMMHDLAEQFLKLSNGVYPLGISKLKLDTMEHYDTDVRKTAKKLIKFEKKLLDRDRKRKLTDESEHDTPEEDLLQENLPETHRLEKNGETKENVPEKKVLKKRRTRKVNENKAKVVPDKPAMKRKVVKENPPIQPKKRKISEDLAINTLKMGTMKMLKDSLMVQQKTERSKSKKKQMDQIKTRSKSKVNNNHEKLDYTFERESGTWLVFQVEKPSQPNHSGTAVPIPDKIKNISPFKSVPVIPSVPIQISNKNKVAKQVKAIESVPKKSFVSATKPPKRTRKHLFPTSGWDDSEQQQIKVSSQNRRALRERKITHVASSLKSKKQKKRPRVFVENPFAEKRVKKVKINTKLNSSQEVYEHHRQILSSPGIPYDANKKPSKPLLKTPPRSSPINPFYKLRYSL